MTNLSITQTDAWRRCRGISKKAMGQKVESQKNSFKIVVSDHIFVDVGY